MKILLYSAVSILLGVFASAARGTQADDTTVAITGQTAGATPFISQLTLSASDTSVIRSVQFTVAPKPGSVTRPLSGTYSREYLVSRGYLIPPDQNVFMPIYGLYANFTNSVTLTFHFFDGSSKEIATSIATAAFDDPCGYETPTVRQARNDSQALSFDFMLVKNGCSSFSPAILDTDSNIRWVGPAGITNISATFFDNAVYIGGAGGLYRLDLDGTVQFVASYADLGITFIHHNIDLGKDGIILDVNTSQYLESTNIEVDKDGKLLRKWSLGDIISAAMIAGGDDPSGFVAPSPGDWFHNNATAYNRADDSLVVSSRENFVICLDYESGAIKWILGDESKTWFQYPSLRQFELTVAPGGLAPLGQHAVSITYDQGLLMLDNGESSRFQIPQGDRRLYASPRKYQIDTTANVATEVWNYPMDESVFSSFCSSVYEDAPLNYLVTYSLVTYDGFETSYSQILALDNEGNKVFYYQYPTDRCSGAFNSIPLHLEKTSFPAIRPRTLNLSARGNVAADNDSLIGGFIVTGLTQKTIALRALGPSLASAGVAGALANPILHLYDATGALVATNDDWQSDSRSAELTANHLAPADPVESAILTSLNPGQYTVVINGRNAAASGIGLVEVYDLSPQVDSKLANISARAKVTAEDGALITGFIVGDVDNATVIVRALGPSLAAFDVTNPLANPVLTVYDANGAVIASNDDWRNDVNAPLLTKNGLAPVNDLEAAVALHPPAGGYSAVVQGVGETTGVGLAEVFDLD